MSSSVSLFAGKKAARSIMFSTKKRWIQPPSNQIWFDVVSNVKTNSPCRSVSSILHKNKVVQNEFDRRNTCLRNRYSLWRSIENSFPKLTFTISKKGWVSFLIQPTNFSNRGIFGPLFKLHLWSISAKEVVMGWLHLWFFFHIRVNSGPRWNFYQGSWYSRFTK